MQCRHGHVLTVAAGHPSQKIRIGSTEAEGCRTRQGGGGHVVDQLRSGSDGHQARAGDRQGVDRGQIGRECLRRGGIELGGAGHARGHTAEVCRQGIFQSINEHGAIAGERWSADCDAIGLKGCERQRLAAGHLKGRHLGGDVGVLGDIERHSALNNGDPKASGSTGSGVDVAVVFLVVAVGKRVGSIHREENEIIALELGCDFVRTNSVVNGRLHVGQRRTVGDADIGVSDVVVSEGNQIRISRICHVALHIGEHQPRLGIDVVLAQIKGCIIQRGFIGENAYRARASGIAQGCTVGLLGGEHESSCLIHRDVNRGERQRECADVKRFSTKNDAREIDFGARVCG